MDDVILDMLETFKIELFVNNYYYCDSFSSSMLLNTFLELLFKNNKITIIKKIIDNEKIYNKYHKNHVIGNILFLSLYYNFDELTYHIFENYLQSVNPSIFIISLKDKLNIKNNNLYICTSGLELVFTPLKI